MIVGLDSAYAPSASQALAAKVGGVHLWSGYLATRSGVGLYHPWAQADFDNARLCGSTPIAFCSGWDDPVACRALADRWNVRLCLDVESGIRPDGAWVQGWLDKAGAGLYGVIAVHTGRQAAFHVLAWYTANAGATWAGQRPSAPCGWQWQNSHQEFGVTVDRGWYDDWFAGSVNATAGEEVRVPLEEPMTLSQKWSAVRTWYGAYLGRVYPELTNDEIKGWVAQIDDDGNNVDAIQQAFITGAQKDPEWRLKSGLAGPPGPKGDPGPAGPQGPAGISPTIFAITGTAKAV